ncbi:target of Nesh-SH3-like [Hypanus sabinus]|uniref:target of Nesh-SH3-like n=1 Tax=Hypanus sabinus TaxID=79690 RepID=UPI0028C43EEE|nr:target of Nesh-SH3-like [Hypanus sabinus]
MNNYGKARGQIFCCLTIGGCYLTIPVVPAKPSIFLWKHGHQLFSVAKEGTNQKLPKSDDYASNPAPISERGYTEEQEFKASEPTDSETSHVLISTPRSELDKKEDQEFTDYKQPASGTPNVLSQSQEPTHDKIKDEDLAGPKTPSTVSQLPSTSSRSTQGPHVKYLTKENMPCSITESLKHFEEENSTNATALTAPKYPPSNLTLVTVEGCPTFLIVDWKKNENDTASEYEVVSQMQGPDNKTEKLVTVTNQTHAAVENLKPNTSYTFSVTPTNKHGRGPSSDSLPFVTESADPSVSEYIPGKDAIWTQYSFKFDSYSECQGKRFVKRTRYRKFVGIILCNSLRYKIYLSNSLSGIFYNIGDLSGHGEDHCQFVDSFLDGRTGEHLLPEQLPIRQGFYRSVRQEPVMFGTIGGQTHINYVHWYECGIAIPGQW